MGQKCKLILLYVICMMIQRNTVSPTTSNETMYTIMRQIIDGYEKELPPKFDKASDKQVAVYINVYIQSMYAFSDANMDYSMTMFLRERWVDERLRYPDTQKYPRLELEGPMVDKLWLPDVYIINEKESDYHEVTVPNKMAHLYPNGTVQYSAKVTGTFSCLMYLKKYPFDTQVCHLEMESYGHSTETLKFYWSNEAVSMSKGIEFPNFWLANISIYECEKTYYSVLYPCIGVKFTMRRNYEFHILHIYLPSILIVILSWLNFWLDCTAVPARITLGLLTVLTMTTQTSNSMENMSHVSYLKAIDVYIAVCLTFVFMGLVEFAYVNVLTRAERKETTDTTKELKTVDGVLKKNTRKSKYVSCTQTTWNELLCFSRLSNLGRARLVDKISRVIFPLMFGVFNIFYWCFYVIF
ncbi:glycine receptor subunit alpha-3-like isoform X2 [Mercenaria mercenaria]|uniref:glycine receptor subunit alpha-3-like isoform X2 n=1 Tax=Mercenaria mercenaria TaxID=6596 RepID=UPI00234EFD89|nr:glycine receptor subunit alpha-3-like isoform X2 [Mercenaria mercenaria]